MESITDVLDRVETITFDCYGTLIDWHAGLTATFREMFGPAIENRNEELCDLYLRIEAELQAERFRSYRDLLGEVAKRLAQRIDLDLPPDRSDLLAERLPTWKPFSDTNDALVRLKRKYRLGVLSNIDRDLFAGTAGHFDVAFDFLVTAEDVRTYKPHHAHFEQMLSAHGPREKVLHVAQSLFHDGVPAQELGIAYVWINRYIDSNSSAVVPLAEFPDLKSLADAAGDG